MVATVSLPLQAVWATDFASVNASTISLILRTVSAAVENERTSNPSAQVVWTGPKVNGSYFRATRQVVRELVSHSTDHMLVVGYWLAGTAGNLSIINEIVDSIAEAVREREVEVSMVLDTGSRPDGSSNYDVLQSLWPTDLPLPNLLTWNIPDNEPHLKIHAKVIVCDRKEALVTSANLTQHALERNIEMGLHIHGDACMRITQHFELLETQGILEPFSNDSTT